MTEQNNPQPRVFKIGATISQEDASLAGKSLEEITNILKHTYPEVAHAAVRQRTLGDGSHCYDFIPRPGRKSTELILK